MFYVYFLKINVSCLHTKINTKINHVYIIFVFFALFLCCTVLRRCLGIKAKHFVPGLCYKNIHTYIINKVSDTLGSKSVITCSSVFQWMQGPPPHRRKPQPLPVRAPSQSQIMLFPPYFHIRCSAYTMAYIRE